jgi:DNA-directed RNA polymerase specialized sigma24 family protein
VVGLGAGQGEPPDQGSVVSAFAAHHRELYAFLARATLDPAVAEDLLRQTYARLASEVRAGRPPSNARAWLYRVASELVSRPGRRTGSEVIAGGSQGAELEDVLRGLSPEARVALLLSAEGFSGPEIAGVMGRSVPETRTLLYRARSRVRIRRELFAAGP